MQSGFHVIDEFTNSVSKLKIRIVQLGLHNTG